MRFTVLGAGAMGSAFATPLRAGGHDVRLWGTWLDGDILETLRRGEPHPGTGVRLAAGCALHDADDLAAALDGAEAVLVAISSAGLTGVLDRALPLLPPGAVLGLATKGFVATDDGPVLIPDAVRARAPEARLAVVGGPCKANEVAAGRPTIAVVGADDLARAEGLAGAMSTPAYRVEVCADERGVEVCAALKNVYAIALGIADGLPTDDPTGEQPWHDLRAALFTRAVRELSEATALAGGDPATPYGPAGVGDLEVTGLSGRNKVFGARVGAGERPSVALDAMAAQGRLVEGVPAAHLARGWVGADLDRLPLLAALGDLLDTDRSPGADADARDRIVDAALHAR